VRFLAGEAGIRQFLDIGTGLPTQGNVHEVAQAVAPDARVVYVDFDPIVLSHARALLAGDHVVIVHGDLRDPGGILENPELREVLDFEQPIALLLVAILHFVHDRDDPAAILKRLREALAPGSYLAISHATGDFDPERTVEALKIYKGMLALRSHAEVERFFDGFDLLDPGVVEVDRWRPDGETTASPLPVPIYGGLGRLR
jgi:SAM-dependent methyltransferase